MVRNYALIERLTIEFGPGLNVLSGETGAGKSIILGALSLVLGERADASVIRTGAESVEVTARFEQPSELPPTADGGAEAAEEGLILRRKQERTGRSAGYINDAAVTIAALREAGDRLVDLHGQHQHQLLFSPEVHLETLDRYGRLMEERRSYEDEYRRLVEMRAELKRLEAELAERARRRDLTEYQSKELCEAAVKPGERTDLLAERDLLASAEKRYMLARELEGILSEQEGSCLELIGAVERRLAELGRLDDRLAGRRSAAVAAESALDDLWRELVSYRESVRFSPERMEEVNARLFLIEKLEKKYGTTGDELAELGGRLAAEIGSLEFDRSRADERRQEIARLEKRLSVQAEALSKKRKAAAKRFESLLEKEFAALGLEKARVEVKFDRTGDGRQNTGEREHGNGDRKRGTESEVEALTPTGLDRVEFLFCANPGEELRPLRKVASGGELSRIMLGMKNVLSDVELVPTMVFDEIDVGIGGRVAEAVGRRLSALGKGHQVVCITHLPQIAKYADRHFLVAKRTVEGRARTTIEGLEGDERVAEIARMTEGERITEAGLAHAREMLRSSANAGRRSANAEGRSANAAVRSAKPGVRRVRAK